jgi:hypothetical protein
VLIFENIDNSFGTRWLHLLEDEKKFPEFPTETEKLPDNFLNDYHHKLNGKINYLAKKFLSLKDNPTLYVVSEIMKPLTNEILVNLRDALCSCRDNDQQFAILVMTDNRDITSFENIIVRTAKHKKGEWHPVDWDSGNTEQWQSVFNEFSYEKRMWQDIKK